MSAEDNKDLVLRYVEEILNRGRTDRLADFFSQDAVDHDPLPGRDAGLEGIEEGVASLRSAFADLGATVEDVIAEGDRVVTRTTITGTHEGEFLSMAPTGKRVSVTAVDIVRIENGKLVERWGLLDQMALMRQLGVVPMTGPPSGASPPETFPS